MDDEERMKSVERRLEEWECFGCKGKDLMDQYPYLRELPALKRKRAFMKIAVHRQKMAITARILGETPAQ